jgi:hypothetical protein
MLQSPAKANTKQVHTVTQQHGLETAVLLSPAYHLPCQLAEALITLAAL